MQKKNPVIKDYILSSEKRILKESSLSKNESVIAICYPEILLYRSLLRQNTDFLSLFLLRK